LAFASRISADSSNLFSMLMANDIESIKAENSLYNLRLTEAVWYRRLYWG
jgi:hypothetical protein